MTLPSSLRLKSKPAEEAQSPLEQQQSLPSSLKKKPQEPGLVERMGNMGSNFLKNVKSFENTIIKGSVEGVANLEKMISPRTDISRKNAKTEKQELEQITENLNKLLPSDEEYTQNALRRGLRQAPSALAFPGSTLKALPKVISAGFIGEGAKEFGAPEWAQSALELTAYVGPELMKKLIEKGSNAEIIKAARQLGLSDEAITQLTQSDFKMKWLSKLIPRRGGMQSKLENTYRELGKTYSVIENSEKALGSLSKESADTLLKEFSEMLHEMPAGVRNKVKEDFRDLLTSKATGKDLINFYKDVNHYLGENAKELSRLKEPIRKALKSIDPQLGEDFELVNNLFSKYHGIASKLKPNMKTDIAEAILGTSEALSTVFSIVTGNPLPILTLGTQKVGRMLVKEMVTNPRFQQISRKMVEAVNNNNYAMAKKLSDLLSHEVGKIDPELSDKIHEISLDDFKKLFNQKEEPKE